MTATDTQTEALPVKQADPTPMMLLQQALNSDLDVEKLERLLALQERWEKNQAEKAFAESMHACQGEMPVVVKDARNTQTNSDYALKETVQHRIKPVYTKHGFSISFAEEDCPLEGFKRTIADVTHEGGHTRRYHADLPVDGVGPKGNAIGGMNRVQGGISTMSYGQRVLLCMIFNVTVAGTDLDGNNPRDCISPEQIDELKKIAGPIPDGRMDKFFGIYGMDIGKWEQMTQEVYPSAKRDLIRVADIVKKEKK